MITDYCKKINIPYDSNWNRFNKFLLAFIHFYFVYPPLNNERIRRQQGAFLVFPPIASDYWKINNFHEPSRITIKSEAKKTLLKELAHLGFTRSYLFPELEEQAKDIKLRYPQQ
jgi:hypothetical protein